MFCINWNKIGKLILLFFCLFELLFKITVNLVNKSGIERRFLNNVLKSVSFFIFSVLVFFDWPVFLKLLSWSNFLMNITHFCDCKIDNIFEDIFETLESRIPLDLFGRVVRIFTLNQLSRTFNPFGFRVGVVDLLDSLD